MGPENSPPDKYNLRVLLNAAPLSGVLTGIARYTRALYGTILDLRLAEVSFFVNGRINKGMPNQSKGAISRYFPEMVRNIVRESKLVLMEYRLNRQCRNHNADVYHETSMFPISRDLPIRTVLTIYDLSLLKYREFHPRDRVAHFERHFYNRLNTVDRVITLTEFIRNEIIDLVGMAPHMVSSIPLAPADVFHKRPQAMVDRYLASKDIAKPYILSVATNEPRKNLAGLVHAMHRSRAPKTLVFAGWDGWLNRDTMMAIRQFNIEHRIVRLGHVPDKELGLLYSGAAALAFTSFYEGFGLPILEAMASGCPVVCSNCGAMAEVAGDAAILVDPNHPEAVSAAMDQIIEDSELRTRLITMGYRRIQDFSWERTATETIAVFERVRIQAG